MEKAELNKLILMVVIFCICCIQKVTGVSEAYLTNYTKCAFSLANIDFNISLDAADSIVGKRTWLLHGNKIAESNGITLTPVASYSSRLTAYGTYGISLSNVNVADTGTYTYVVVLSPSGNPITATATLSVQEPPNAGCSVDASQSGIIVTCSVSGSCGTPVLEPDWENETGISNMFHCDKQKTYRCCATSAALKNCYTGSPDNFCKVYSCSRDGGNPCPVELEITVGIGLALIILGFIMYIVIFVVKADQCLLGLVISFVIAIIGCIICIVGLALKGQQLKLGLCICFGIILLVCIICIIIMVSVKNGNYLRLGHCICFAIIIIISISCIVILAIIGGECPQSFQIGFGIGFGILIIVCIICILILIFSKKVTIQNKDTSANLRTDEKEVTITAIIYGLWISVEWIKEKTILENNEDYTIKPYDNNTRKSFLIIKRTSMTNIATYICRAKNLCGCCSAEDYIKLPHDKDKPKTGPPGTKNKVDPKTTSEQTNLLPVDTGVKDTQKIRPQPKPPQNSDIKDRNQRGISATIDDTPGLANETPRPSKLPPLPQKQTTSSVQDEDPSEEPKMKRKKKKKKDQMNDGNPEVEIIEFSTRTYTIQMEINQ